MSPSGRDLLSLPTELIINILVHLPLSSLPAVHLSCRTLHVLLDSSVSVQYNKWLEMTGCVDYDGDGDGDEGNGNGINDNIDININDPSVSTIGNPSASASASTSTSLSTKDKLDLLQSKFHAWDRLVLNDINDPRSSSSLIQVHHRPSGIYDLTGGVYLLGSEDGRELYWVYLPGGEGGEDEEGRPLRWHKVRTDKAIVDMGLCVYEHDLLGIVTTHPSDSGSQHPPQPQFQGQPQQPQGQGQGQEQIIELSFIHLPTNRPHRLAQVNPIVVDSYTSGSPPAIALEIVGHHLVLVLSYSFRLGLGFLFHQHQQQQEQQQAHPGPLDKVFVYNWTTGVLLAQFDKAARTYSSVVFLTPRLFLLPNARENQLEVYRIPEVPVSAGSGEGDEGRYGPEMVLRLPRLAQERIISSISCRGEPAPYSSSSSLMMKGKKPFLSSPASSIMIFNIRILPAEMFVGFPLLGNVSTLVVQRQAIVDLLSSLSSSPSTHTPLILPYASWGPPLTRWFTSSQIPTRWITTSASTRLVLIPSSALDTDVGSPYLVCDFNPCAVKWTRKRKAEAKEVRRVVQRRLGEVVKGLTEVAGWEKEMRRAERERERGREVKSGRRDRLKERERELQMELDWEDMHIPGAWVDSEHHGLDPPPATSSRYPPSQSDLDRHLFHIHSVDPDRDLDVDVDVDVNMGVDRDVDMHEPAYDSDGSSSGLGRGLELVMLSGDLELVPLEHPFREEYTRLHRRYEELREEMGRMWTVGDSRLGNRSSRRDARPGGNRTRNANTDEDEGGGEGGGRYEWEDEEEEEEEDGHDSSLLPPESQQLFDDPGGLVRGSLPYAARLSPGRYRWDGVLMDEERVLGITTDRADRVQSVSVHYFG